MRILVFGAGAIGSVLGGLLANAGHDVTLLGRAWHLDVVRQDGLLISGLWGEHRVRRLELATQVGEVPRHAAFDWIFVCVKSHQTAQAARILPELLGRRTLVCAFQNGLGYYEVITEEIPPERVALGRVIFGAEIEPGHVRVTVCADQLLIGSLADRFPAECAQRLAEAFCASGIPSRMSPSILVDLWAKMLYNCALNALSTLLEVPYGNLLDRPLARRMIHAIVEEAYSVAEVHHIPLEPKTAPAYLELLFSRLIPDTAAHRPSMLQDIRRGRPTEIEALNGAIVRLAHEAGLAAPMNALVTHLVHAKEQLLAVPARG